MASVDTILKQYWGYDRFRPLQEDIIHTLLSGNDVLAILPTGGGKSICFQVPALATDGMCLVISPLIALMKDQVQNLQKRGIPALSLFSGMSFIEVKKILQNASYGHYKFLYVSPERLQTKLFLEYLSSLPINFIAVDEAHCISQWGYDFRPPYLQIASIREYLPKVPVIALTASATLSVQNDICEKLQFNVSHKRFQQSFERPNLSYSVFNVVDKPNKLINILESVNGSALVYCRSRKQTKVVADLLQLRNINADYYHAGLTADERNRKQEKWIRNGIRVMACTNAFGMGIDKPDVRLVIHYEVPDCIENYYQEAGRAGRDGNKAYTVTLYNQAELTNLKLRSTIQFPSAEEIKNVYIALMNHLQAPAGYGEGKSYDFDMVNFAVAFKMNILTATYAIKALEQEGILTYTESFFKPSSVVFTSSKEDLFEFEKQYPFLEELIKGLLRAYEGIFDFPCTIHESQLAKFIKKPVDAIKEQLLQLHQLGIIAYNQQKDKPQLTLLQNRMYQDAYHLDTTAYMKRKKAYENRITAIIDYLKLQTTCRSTFIARYFNDLTAENCGVCDNCINNKIVARPVGSAEFKILHQELTTILEKKSLSLNNILNFFHIYKRHKVKTLIEYLLAEKKIRMDDKGDIELC